MMKKSNVCGYPGTSSRDGQLCINYLKKKKTSDRISLQGLFWCLCVYVCDVKQSSTRERQLWALRQSFARWECGGAGPPIPSFFRKLRGP